MCARDMCLFFFVFAFLCTVRRSGGLTHKIEPPGGETPPTRRQFYVTCNSSTTARQVNIFDYDVLVVGAGLSGAVLAQQHAEHLHQRVLVLEKRNHTAGNTFDFVNDLGIRVSKYGPHLFHTKSPRVWNYVQRFADWTRYDHRVVGRVDNRLVPIPVNMVTVNKLLNTSLQNATDMKAWLQQHQIPMNFSHNIQGGDMLSGDGVNNITGETAAISRVGPVLFDKIFREYTRKQWAREAAWMAPSVLERIPVHSNFEDRYFPNDPYQALPVGGYADFVRRMLNTKATFSSERPSEIASGHIDVCLGADFFESIPTTILGQWQKEPAETPSLISAATDVCEGDTCQVVTSASTSRSTARRVFFTGPVDQFFQSHGLPQLEYRSIRFEVVDLPSTPVFQPTPVVNYPQDVDGRFTRIVEYKHFEWSSTAHLPGTTIVKEFSTADGEPYYPVPDQRNKDLYERYRQLAVAAEQNDAVYFVGRLANYKYMNMDEAILNALTTFDRVHPEIMNHTKIISTEAPALVQKNKGNDMLGPDFKPNAVSVVTAMPRGSSTAWLQSVTHSWCHSYSVPSHAQRGEEYYSRSLLRFVVYTPVGKDGNLLDQQELHTLQQTLDAEFGSGRCRIDIVPLHDSHSQIQGAAGIPPKRLTFHERAVLRFLLTASSEGFGAANVFLPWAAGGFDSGVEQCISRLAASAARIARAKTFATLDAPACRHVHGENVSALLSGHFGDTVLSSHIDGPHFYSDEMDSTFEARDNNNTCDAPFPVLTLSESCLRQVVARSLERLVVLGQLPSAVGFSND